MADKSLVSPGTVAEGYKVTHIYLVYDPDTNSGMDGILGVTLSREEAHKLAADSFDAAESGYVTGDDEYRYAIKKVEIDYRFEDL